MTEVWKPISGYEGLYEVSDSGRVRTTDRRMMSPFKNNRGYSLLGLTRDGEKKHYLVHRLVADAFCFKPEGCDIVNHIDNNPQNNCASNLEWVTQSENLYHASKIGVFLVRPVVRSDGKIYPSLNATQADGFIKSCVCYCCQGKLRTHKGYSWRYADESS